MQLSNINYYFLLKDRKSSTQKQQKWTRNQVKKKKKLKKGTRKKKCKKTTIFFSSIPIKTIKGLGCFFTSVPLKQGRYSCKHSVVCFSYPVPADSVSTRSPPSQPWGESSWPCRSSSRMVWRTLFLWLSAASLRCTFPTMLWHLWWNDSGAWGWCCLLRFQLCPRGDRVFSAYAWFPWNLITEQCQCYNVHIYVTL